MSERPAFLESCKDPIFNEVVWVPANEKFGHVITVRRPPEDGLAPLTPNYFDMRFSLGKVSTVSDLIRMMFHGNPAWHKTVHEFMGLSSLYSTINSSRAQNAANVIDAGGKESLTSIYFVNWDERTAFMSYQVDEAGELYAGLAPKDWRYIVRVANVDEEADIPSLMTKALLMSPSVGSGAAFYMKKPIADHYRGVPIRAVGALHRREHRVV